MATDLAEFLGAAIGFNLLFGVPLWVAGILTGITTFIILGLERKGFRPLEAVISAMVGVVAISYVIETIIVKPIWGQVLIMHLFPNSRDLKVFYLPPAFSVQRSCRTRYFSIPR